MLWRQIGWVSRMDGECFLEDVGGRSGGARLGGCGTREEPWGPGSTDFGATYGGLYAVQRRSAIGKGEV